MRQRRVTGGFVYCSQCNAQKPATAKICDTCGTVLIWKTIPTQEVEEMGDSYSMVGRTLAKNYCMEKVIGREVSGVVYRGVYLPEQRQVAIKILAPYLAADPALMLHFEAEVQRQMNLIHPNIVPLQKFLADNNIKALISEYVDGISLDHLLRETSGPLSPQRILELMLPVLDAVEFSHEHGIVHYDIKPSNIVIALNGKTEVPRVMDFGIATMYAQGGSHTMPAIVPKAILYMSPEHLKAQSNVDARSDIYSLGVILYQMATGVVPFESNNAYETMLAHVQQSPMPPKNFNPNISQQLQDVILKCLEKDPDKRFQSACELALALKKSISTSNEKSTKRSITSDIVAAQPNKIIQSQESKPPSQLDEKIKSQPNRLKLRIVSPTDWKEYFDPNAAGGGIFCPTAEPPFVGTHVYLEILFVGGPRFFVRGIVTWRRPQSNDRRARAGVGVQVHPADQNRVAYVNAWVRGGVSDKRQQRRLPVKLRVTYSAKSGHRVNFTRDLNETSVFVHSSELLKPGTRINLLIAPHDDSKPFDLVGKITRLIKDQEQRGMGIQLEFPDSTKQEQFAEFVAQLEKAFVTGQLPDKVIS